MTARVWRDGGLIRKRISARAAARDLIKYTEGLRAGGVATPQVQFEERDQTLVFPFIEGATGLAVIEERSDPALAGLLRPLLALHQTVLDGLYPFDPVAKITQRLAPGDPTALRENLQALLAELPDRSFGASVHGDFHAGQLVLDASGTTWLLDLEDLATGAPESDLGNFAAHLATSPQTQSGSILQGFEHWLGHTLEAYHSIGGVADFPLARTHGRIALIRRAVKLRERGDPSILTELAGR